MSFGINEPAPGQRQVVYGYVALHQPAPAGYDDPLYVTVPDYDPNDFYTCVHWPKIHGRTFPQPGADVLLIFDDQGRPGNPRVVWWAGNWTEWDRDD